MAAVTRIRSQVHNLTTYYFVALFIPIIPIRRYRVVDAGGGTYRFLGVAPLRTADRWHLGMVLGGFLAYLVLTSVGTETSRNAPSNLWPQYSPSPVAREGPSEHKAYSGDPLPQSTPPATPGVQSREDRLRSLKANIDAGRSRITAMEDQLRSLQAEHDSIARRLDEYKLEIDRHKREVDLEVEGSTHEHDRAIKAHNALIPRYNSLVSEYKSAYADHETLLEQDKRLVAQYNALAKR